MWAPDIYEGSPTPVTTFLSIAPKISIYANISRVSIYGSYGATLQQILFYCNIASMILGALAAMAQTKVKGPLPHSSIGHVGYIRTSFSCGTIEGVQALLIALRQTCVRYIVDLGALAKTNPISAITFSITMFSYAGIPPLADFCSKFNLFFAALGCGAYFLAAVGVTTSVIGRWGARRLPRVNRVESNTSTVYSISLYESTITTRDEPWFGELNLALGVIGHRVTTRDRIMRCSPPVVGTTRPSSFPSLPRGKALQSFLVKSTRRIFFDTPRTWILYEPMDRDKSLLLAMTSSFITSSIPYPSPLFSVNHQMELNLYL
ncbi:hypothetical protein G4B88_000649 [Cannabis sativa]|uniref:NADH:quinone oxidoreductase/Mrp antiporter transmembrane domain-containing protein n=1 Tax=Cannabis sativa TaxID=3483 RepID=A0A7J6HHG3_CANSA|nr:hypothetical protein G4B88_000649 [Cannabis sativa]